VRPRNAARAALHLIESGQPLFLPKPWPWNWMGARGYYCFPVEKVAAVFDTLLAHPAARQKTRQVPGAGPVPGGMGSTCPMPCTIQRRSCEAMAPF